LSVLSYVTEGSVNSTVYEVKRFSEILYLQVIPIKRGSNDRVRTTASKT